MFYNAITLHNYKLRSRDGEIGRVKDFYFDDHHWAIRYLVAETGTWLNNKQVLISPYALKAVTLEEKVIAVNLTMKQIEDSPSLDTDKPVSRQFEMSYYGYYGWPNYWGGPFMWGAYPNIILEREKWKKETKEKNGWDSNLRSAHDVSGYHIQASEGEVGHVHDFIIDDNTWAIRYIVVDTTNLLPGKKVLVSPQWIESINWIESKVIVNLSLETIKQSPAYTVDSLLSRDYETILHQYYKRQGYWANEPAAKEFSL